MKPELKELEKRIGYTFQDKSLLLLALTHTSYANEHRKQGCHHNERLEFLGDAVLETVSSEYLYKKFPERMEGELSKLRASMVCEPALAYCARNMGLPDFILLGRGEEMTGGRERDSIISDATEALIGAIYLDGGFNKAKEFILSFILDDVETRRLFVDCKTILQEIAQSKTGRSLEYVLVREDGPDHDKHFTVHVRMDGEVLGRGEGHTKKAAEQAAAYEAVLELKRKGSN